MRDVLYYQVACKLIKSIDFDINIIEYLYIVNATKKENNQKNH